MTERLSEQQRVVNPEKLIQWFRKKYRTSTMNNESAYNWSKEYFQKRNGKDWIFPEYTSPDNLDDYEESNESYEQTAQKHDEEGGFWNSLKKGSVTAWWADSGLPGSKSAAKYYNESLAGQLHETMNGSPMYGPDEISKNQNWFVDAVGGFVGMASAVDVSLLGAGKVTGTLATKTTKNAIRKYTNNQIIKSPINKNLSQKLGNMSTQTLSNLDSYALIGMRRAQEITANKGARTIAGKYVARQMGFEGAAGTAGNLFTYSTGANLIHDYHEHHRLISSGAINPQTNKKYTWEDYDKFKGLKKSLWHGFQTGITGYGMGYYLKGVATPAYVRAAQAIKANGGTKWNKFVKYAGSPIGQYLAEVGIFSAGNTFWRGWNGDLKNMDLSQILKTFTDDLAHNAQIVAGFKLLGKTKIPLIGNGSTLKQEVAAYHKAVRQATRQAIFEKVPNKKYFHPEDIITNKDGIDLYKLEDMSYQQAQILNRLARELREQKEVKAAKEVDNISSEIESKHLRREQSQDFILSALEDVSIISDKINKPNAKYNELSNTDKRSSYLYLPHIQGLYRKTIDGWIANKEGAYEWFAGFWDGKKRTDYTKKEWNSHTKLVDGRLKTYDTSINEARSLWNRFYTPEAKAELNKSIADGYHIRVEPIRVKKNNYYQLKMYDRSTNEPVKHIEVVYETQKQAKDAKNALKDYYNAEMTGGVPKGKRKYVELDNFKQDIIETYSSSLIDPATEKPYVRTRAKVLEGNEAKVNELVEQGLARYATKQEIIDTAPQWNNENISSSNEVGNRFNKSIDSFRSSKSDIAGMELIVGEQITTRKTLEQIQKQMLTGKIDIVAELTQNKTTKKPVSLQEAEMNARKVEILNKKGKTDFIELVLNSQMDNQRKIMLLEYMSRNRNFKMQAMSETKTGRFYGQPKLFKRLLELFEYYDKNNIGFHEMNQGLLKSYFEMKGLAENSTERNYINNAVSYFYGSTAGKLQGFSTEYLGGIMISEKGTRGQGMATLEQQAAIMPAEYGKVREHFSNQFESAKIKENFIADKPRRHKKGFMVESDGKGLVRINNEIYMKKKEAQNYVDIDVMDTSIEFIRFFGMRGENAFKRIKLENIDLKNGVIKNLIVGVEQKKGTPFVDFPLKDINPELWTKVENLVTKARNKGAGDKSNLFNAFNPNTQLVWSKNYKKDKPMHGKDYNAVMKEMQETINPRLLGKGEYPTVQDARRSVLTDAESMGQVKVEYELNGVRQVDYVNMKDFVDKNLIRHAPTEISGQYVIQPKEKIVAVLKEFINLRRKGRPKTKMQEVEEGASSEKYVHHLYGESKPLTAEQINKTLNISDKNQLNPDKSHRIIHPKTRKAFHKKFDMKDPSFGEIIFRGNMPIADEFSVYRPYFSMKVDGKEAFFYRSSSGTAGDYKGKLMPILGVQEGWIMKDVSTKKSQSFEKALAKYPEAIKKAARHINEKVPMEKEFPSERVEFGAKTGTTTEGREAWRQYVENTVKKKYFTKSKLMEDAFERQAKEPLFISRKESQELINVMTKRWGLTKEQIQRANLGPKEVGSFFEGVIKLQRGTWQPSDLFHEFYHMFKTAGDITNDKTIKSLTKKAESLAKNTQEYKDWKARELNKGRNFEEFVGDVTGVGSARLFYTKGIIGKFNQIVKRLASRTRILFGQGTFKDYERLISQRLVKGVKVPGIDWKGKGPMKFKKISRNDKNSNIKEAVGMLVKSIESRANELSMPPKEFVELISASKNINNPYEAMSQFIKKENVGKRELTDSEIYDIQTIQQNMNIPLNPIANKTLYSEVVKTTDLENLRQVSSKEKTGALEAIGVKGGLKSNATIEQLKSYRDWLHSREHINENQHIDQVKALETINSSQMSTFKKMAAKLNVVGPNVVDVIYNYGALFNSPALKKLSQKIHKHFSIKSDHEATFDNFERRAKELVGESRWAGGIVTETRGVKNNLWVINSSLDRGNLKLIFGYANEKGVSRADKKAFKQAENFLRKVANEDYFLAINYEKFKGPNLTTKEKGTNKYKYLKTDPVNKTSKNPEGYTKEALIAIDYWNTMASSVGMTHGSEYATGIMKAIRLIPGMTESSFLEITKQIEGGVIKRVKDGYFPKALTEKANEVIQPGHHVYEKALKRKMNKYAEEDAIKKYKYYKDLDFTKQAEILNKSSENSPSIMEIARSKAILDMQRGIQFAPDQMTFKNFKERTLNFEPMILDRGKWHRTYEIDYHKTISPYILSSARFFANVQVFPEATKIDGLSYVESADIYGNIRFGRDKIARAAEKYVKDNMDSILGKNPETPSGPEKFMAEYAKVLGKTLLSFPKAAFKNLGTGSSQTALLYGSIDIAKSVADAIRGNSKLERKYLEVSPVKQELAIYQGEGRLNKFLDRTAFKMGGMHPSEKFNRRIPIYASQYDAARQIRRLQNNPVGSKEFNIATDRLKDVYELNLSQRALLKKYGSSEGVEGNTYKDINLRLELKDIEKQIMNMAHVKTQGSTDAAFMPSWATKKGFSPLLLFKRMAYKATVNQIKNTKVAGKSVIKNGQLKNILRPMLSMAVTYGTGVGLAGLFGKLLFKEDMPHENSPWYRRFLHFLWKGEFLGIFSEFLSPYDTGKPTGPLNNLATPAIFSNFVLGTTLIGNLIPELWGEGKARLGGINDGHALDTYLKRSFAAYNDLLKIWNAQENETMVNGKRNKKIVDHFSETVQGKKTDYASGTFGTTTKSPYRTELEHAFWKGTDKEFAQAYWQAVFKYAEDRATNLKTTDSLDEIIKDSVTEIDKLVKDLNPAPISFYDALPKSPNYTKKKKDDLQTFMLWMMSQDEGVLREDGKQVLIRMAKDEQKFRQKLDNRTKQMQYIMNQKEINLYGEIFKNFDYTVNLEEKGFDLQKIMNKINKLKTTP